MKKRILSMLLAVLMLTSILPMSAINTLAKSYTVSSGSIYTQLLNLGDTIAKGVTVKSQAQAILYVNGQRTNGNIDTYTTERCYRVAEYNFHYSPSMSYCKIVTDCSMSSATCQSPSKCADCGYTSGSALGHNYTNYRDGGQATAATCTTAATHYKMCSRCTTKSGTYSYGSALGHDYTNYRDGGKVSDATCTTAETHKKMCSRCSTTSGTYTKGSALGHEYTKQGTLVSEATVDSPAIYNKQCKRCTATSGTMEVGNKLPAMSATFTDPETREDREIGNVTNDNVSELVNTLVTMPIQKKNQIFTGWYVGDKGLDRNTTRFEEFTNITAGFFKIVPMAKDEHDEKNVTDYLTFELAGVQIREENTKEVDKEEVYGGLRFVASLSDDIMNNLDIIQYGFAVTSKANADANANANGNENYVIKNKDKNVRLVNCMGMTDHRTFAGNYRLYTMVIDYEGNEALKDEEMVVRPYIAYYDANGTARIFYGSYRGTNTYGGLSTSYNKAVTL